MVFKNTNLYFRVDKEQCINQPRCIYGLYATVDTFLAGLGQKRTETVGTSERFERERALIAH